MVVHRSNKSILEVWEGVSTHSLLSRSVYEPCLIYWWLVQDLKVYSDDNLQKESVMILTIHNPVRAKWWFALLQRGWVLDKRSHRSDDGDSAVGGRDFHTSHERHVALDDEALQQWRTRSNNTFTEARKPKHEVEPSGLLLIGRILKLFGPPFVIVWYHMYQCPLG